MYYKVTVIIPTYNAEKFIKNAIVSVMNQTIGFENIELILVDDNSTDSTREIIKEYSQKYTNIKCFFPKENSGTPSRGRNIGIDNANSNYIMFLDQDDKYKNTFCEVMYDTILKTKTDIVKCQHNLIRNNKYKQSEKDEIIDKTYSIIDPKSSKKLFLKFMVWENIFNTEFLRKFEIKFPEKYFMEDVYFSIKSYKNTDKVAFLENYVGYEYNVRDNSENPSASNSVTKKLYLNSLESFYLIFDLLKDINRQDLINCLMKEILILLIGWFTRLDEDLETKKSILEKLYKLIEDYKFNGKLDEIWAEIIYYHIKKRNFNIAILLSKLINLLFNFYFLRKIYRKIYNRYQ